MADFFGKAGGCDGMARAVGQQAGKVVEGAVKKGISACAQKGQKGGQEGEKKKKEEGGGGGGDLSIDDVLSFDGGNKNEGQRGGGGGGGGGGLGNVVGGLFK